MELVYGVWPKNGGVITTVPSVGLAVEEICRLCSGLWRISMLSQSSLSIDSTNKNRQRIQDAIWQGIMASKIPQERERLLHAHWLFLRQRVKR